MKNLQTEQNPENQQAGESPQLKDPIVIPVIEEQVKIGKKETESGRVVISKSVSEQQESVSVPLNHDEVDVRRVEINKYVDSAPPASRQEGDTTIIPVLREVLVLEKKLLLVEELHVTKKQVQTKEEKQVTLRKEEVKVTRTSSDDT